MPNRSPSLNRNIDLFDTIKELRRPSPKPNTDFINVVANASAVPIGDQGITGVANNDQGFTPVFQSGWTNLDSNPPVGFSMDESGDIQFRGTPVGGAVGTPVYTLPARYVPATPIRQLSSGGDGKSQHAWKADTSGNVFVENVGGTIAGGSWIYVGTPAQVGSTTDVYGTLISSLIAANPSPYNVSPWVPFNPPWTNSLGQDAPVSFMINAAGFVVMRGAAGGGTTETVIFTLPAGYRPFYQQEIIVPSGSFSHYVTCLIGADGTVTYEATI